MKRILIAIAILGSSFTGCNKDNLPFGDDASVPTKTEDNLNGGGGNNVNAASVPAAVMAAFNKAFPNATQMEWKKNSDGTFKVEFFINAVKWQVIYSAAGQVLKQEHS